MQNTTHQLPVKTTYWICEKTRGQTSSEPAYFWLCFLRISDILSPAFFADTDGNIWVVDSEQSLKQQLATAVKARKQLEDTYDGQFKILSQFVSRLSLACKGIDIDLDNKLARLRQEFAKGTDLEKILPLVESAVEALKNLDSRLHK